MNSSKSTAKVSPKFHALALGALLACAICLLEMTPVIAANPHGDPVLTIGGVAMSPSALPEGLTFFSDTVSVVGAWRQGDDMLFFASALGPCKPVDAVVPEHCSNTLGDTGRETDAMILDRNGVPFIVAIGGDAFIDPTWAATIAEGVGRPIDETSRPNDYELAVLLGRSLAASRERDSSGDRLELQAVRDLASSIDINAIRARLHPEPDIIGVDPYDHPDLLTGGATSDAGPRYLHYIAVYSGWVDWTFGIGKHSATLTLVYNESWVPIASYKRGNHGRYHNASGMSFFCDYLSGWRSNVIPHITPHFSSDCYGATCGGGCSTSYGISDGKHVCNDDSHAEFGNVKYNADLSWGVCSDKNLNNYPDSCSSI